VIVLDMDHSEDATHGQQELAFYNHHYGQTPGDRGVSLSQGQRFV
jgi:hypothetical protein